MPAVATAAPAHSHANGPRRPQYEVADILRRYLDEYCQRHKLSEQQRKVLEAIMNCRTEVLGGHVRVCDACGHTEPAYNSCRDRHCPKCQATLKEQWVAARLEDLLPIPYYHLVFTLPHGPLHDLILLNKQVLYTLFFDSAAETRHTFAADPKHLGAQIGFIGVLHTWSQTLGYHVHLHFIVTGGGLGADGSEWVAPQYGDTFLFPVRAMSMVMRGQFLEKLEQAYAQGQLQFAGKIAPLAEPGAFKHFLRQLAREAFVIYSKAPFGSAEAVVKYLGRYTHRVAISNARIVAIEGGWIQFRYKDHRAGGKWKTMRLRAEEFIRRFLLHILPPGFHKIRHYGILSSAVRREKRARALVGTVQQALTEVGEALWSAVERCRVCQVGRMVFRGLVEGRQVTAWRLELTGQRAVFDTS
jgi:hypothetical protein